MIQNKLSMEPKHFWSTFVQSIVRFLADHCCGQSHANDLAKGSSSRKKSFHSTLIYRLWSQYGFFRKEKQADASV